MPCRKNRPYVVSKSKQLKTNYLKEKPEIADALKDLHDQWAAAVKPEKQ
jgi:hypothetical protein